MFSIKAAAGLKVTMLFQLLISGMACIALYHTVKQLTNNNKLMAYVSTTIFIL